MAFEVPAHLPRGGISEDRPTQVLSKLGQVTNKSLNAQLTASWLEELGHSIRDTKGRISHRINEDLPTFERQYESSLSIQRRLLELSNATDTLTYALNDPENGIVPTLLHSLSTHSILMTQTMDSSTITLALEHLAQLRDRLFQLSEEVSQGMLAKASKTCLDLHQDIRVAPSPLDRADIMTAIQKRFRTLNDTVQEQLNNAYGQCVAFPQGSVGLSLTILPSTIPGRTRISLSDILASLSSEFLTDRMGGLRRDILAKFVEPIVKYSQNLEVSFSDSSSSVTLCGNATSPHPLHPLKILLSFLDSHLFPHLPPSQNKFHATLHVPISTALLTHWLKPSLPSSVQGLPSYLELLESAVQFEEELFSAHTRSRPIYDWAADIAKHYEKRRREDFWQNTRDAVINPNDGLTFVAEVYIKPPTPTREEVHTSQKAETLNPEDFSAWDDEDTSGWGFNEAADDEEVEPTKPTSPTAIQKPEPSLSEDIKEASGSHREDDMEDEGDAWGWDEEGDLGDSGEGLETSGKKTSDAPKKTEEDSPWESDNWSIDPESSPSQLSSSPKLETPLAAPAPKLAKRLEKFSAKSKGSKTSSKLDDKQVPSSQQSLPDPPAPMVVSQRIPSSSERVPPKQEKPRELKERFLVSTRVRTILDLVRQILREGEELSSSSVFTVHGRTGALVPGQLLLGAAPSILDLYRAIFPISHAHLLQQSPSFAMQWSNDCAYLAKEASTFNTDDSLAARWAEIVERFQVLADLSYENAIVTEQEVVQRILRLAGGFVHVSKSNRYQECRDAVQATLDELEDTASKWTSMLTRDNYLRAIGHVVDDALFRILDSILLLEDIPEDDSERLSELCEMFNVLEKLFAYGPTEQSVIGSYVPLWFKFSYLSWLIKGSLADISYLFDEGMLVDYEIEELVRLVRALFAETPLRENTIAKIMQGHPDLLPTPSQP